MSVFNISSSIDQTGPFQNRRDRDPPTSDECWVIPLLEKMPNYPAIWNMGSKDYKNTSIRQAQWNQLAKNVSEIYGDEKTVDELKRRWKHIRDHHTKSKRIRPTGSQADSDEDESPSSNKYWAYLTFLDSVNKQRKTSSNLSYYHDEPTTNSDSFIDYNNASGHQSNNSTQYTTHTATRGADGSADEPSTTPALMECATTQRRRSRERPSSDDVESKMISLFEKQSPNSVYGELVINTLDALKRPAAVTQARSELLAWVQKYQGIDDDIE